MQSQAIPFFTYRAIAIPTPEERHAAFAMGEPDPMLAALKDLNDLSVAGYSAQVLVVSGHVVLGKVEGYTLVESLISPGVFK